MKVPYHIGLSLSVSFVVYALYRSIAMATASFLSGILVDLDHIFDYLREYGFRFDTRLFFHSFHHTLYRRIVLPLHAWEWLAALAAGAVLLRGNVIVIGVLIGLGQHLIADQCTTGICKWGYFLSYRAWKKFVTFTIYPGKGLE